jgi:hypothetical protein
VQKDFLGKVDEMTKASWRLDPDKSFAKMTVTPIVDNGDRYYLINEEIVINPYPNPLGMGGMWGHGSVKTRGEVKQEIKQFHKQLERWKARGLHRIDIKEEPERTIPQYRNKLLAERPGQAQLELA